MTYTHRNRVDGTRCYIVTELAYDHIVIQVEGAPCTQILARVVFDARWVQIEAPPVYIVTAPDTPNIDGHIDIYKPPGLCGCQAAMAVERINGLALCAECAAIERRAAG